MTNDDATVQFRVLTVAEVVDYTLMTSCRGLTFSSSCRSWLGDARLGVTSADEDAPLLENPLRNGILLCDLAGRMYCLRAAERSSKSSPVMSLYHHGLLALTYSHIHVAIMH